MIYTMVDIVENLIEVESKTKENEAVKDSTVSQREKTLDSN